jgi:oligoribonuclease NrnB/cAMP/cGMP phosphodiesterase (DHH superfamily)
MKKILKNSNILSISHNDLDGAVSQIVLGHVYYNIKFIHTSFYKIDSILESLDYNKYDYVFLTDIHPDKKDNLYLSDKIILLDHHESAIDYNNPSKMHFVINGQCGSLLTKKFVENMYNIKLNHLDNLVKLTNDYDMWILDYPESKQLNDVMFYLYRPAKFIEKFFDGRTTFTQDELNWLDGREIKFENIYENLKIFEFDKIEGCVAESREFINEISHRLMEEEDYKIVFIRNPSNQRVSVRHKIEELDIGNILKNHGWGGGHAKAAGFFSNDINDFKYKIQILEEEISVDFPK